MEASTIQQKIDLIAKHVFNNAKKQEIGIWNGIYTGEYGCLLFIF